jgi:hypothetical protein
MRNLVKILRLLKIFSEFNINIFVFKLIKNPIKNSTKRVVKEKYDQIILEKLSNLDENSKIFLYNKRRRKKQSDGRGISDYLYHTP